MAFLRILERDDHQDKQTPHANRGRSQSSEIRRYGKPQFQEKVPPLQPIRAKSLLVSSKISLIYVPAMKRFSLTMVKMYIS